MRVGLWLAHKEDLEFLENSADLEIVDLSAKQLLEISPDEYYRFLSKLDMVVFGGDAHFMRQRFVKDSGLKSFQEFFLSPLVKKIWWTMDSHHLWMYEVPFQKYFDRIYIAHSPSIAKFDPSKVRWVSAFFESCGIRSLIEIAARKVDSHFDLGMVYENYSYIGDRNMPIWQISKILDRKKLSYFFGKVQRGQRYLHMLKSCKVGLSISLAGNNVDQRLCEVLGTGGIILSEKVTDHDKIDLDFSHAHFFRRDLSDFEDVLETALADNVTDIELPWKILNNHMTIHRYITIINQELGTDYRVAAIPRWTILDSLKNPMKFLPFFIQGEDKQYSGSILALKAILTNVIKSNYREAFQILDNLELKKRVESDNAEIWDLFDIMHKQTVTFLQNNQSDIWAWVFYLLLCEQKGLMEGNFNNSTISLQNELDTAFLARILELFSKRSLEQAAINLDK